MNTTLIDLAALTEPHWITRDNVNDLLDSHRLEVHITNGRWWSMRRNGATRYWKRDASRIYIPFKYGFKGYGALDGSDFKGPHGSLRLEFFRVRPTIKE